MSSIRWMYLDGILRAGRLAFVGVVWVVREIQVKKRSQWMCQGRSLEAREEPATRHSVGEGEGVPWVWRVWREGAHLQDPGREELTEVRSTSEGA